MSDYNVARFVFSILLQRRSISIIVVRRHTIDPRYTDCSLLSCYVSGCPKMFSDKPRSHRTPSKVSIIGRTTRTDVFDIQ